MAAARSILFVHNGRPGRFAFLAERFAERGWAMALINAPPGNDLPGARTIHWREDRRPTAGIFEPAVKAEADMLRGHAAARAAQELKAEGFAPDLIVGHPGWGEMLFLGEVFPGVPQIQLGELYYRSTGGETDFDPEFRGRGRGNFAIVPALNATLAMSYAEATRIVVPTPYQASRFPAVFGPLIATIHEGVDTALVQRRSRARVTLAGGPLPPDAPVVTFVNRHFEPLRGFHTMMRALPSLLRAVPDVQVLMIGSEASKGYGIKPPEGETWKGRMLAELDGRLDLSRVHFVGPIGHDDLVTLYSLSSAHVYLTYPFVLSWSLLEAMACECLIVGSDTAPVRDVIRHGENGLLVDFFDPEALAATLATACLDGARYDPLRRAARATVLADYDRRTVCEPAWLRLVDEILRLA